MTFRPYLPIRGIVGGALTGISVTVLLQQFAVVYPSRSVVLVAVVGGAVVVLLLVNALRAAATRRSSPAAAVARPAATAGFAGTHRVPASGLDAYDAPGAATPPSRLDPGLDVQVVEVSGDWTHVRCSNGWECWVDGRLLVAR
jgi:hypothetical protein